MLENELADWQVVELTIALKNYAEDLEKRGCFTLVAEVSELRQRIIRSHVILTPFNSI